MNGNPLRRNQRAIGNLRAVAGNADVDCHRRPNPRSAAGRTAVGNGAHLGQRLADHLHLAAAGYFFLAADACFRRAVDVGNRHRCRNVDAALTGRRLVLVLAERILGLTALACFLFLGAIGRRFSVRCDPVLGFGAQINRGGILHFRVIGDAGTGRGIDFV